MARICGPSFAGVPMTTDAGRVLDALFLPFDQGLLPWPDDDVLFLRARAGVALQAGRRGLVCEQSFRPDALALEAAGQTVVAVEPDRRYRLVLVLPPRQRDEARALFARAVAHLAPGGRVVACMPNIAGARSGEDDLRAIAGPVGQLSKHKCRVFWSAPLDAPFDADLAARWAALDRPRAIADGRFMSRPGLFAWDRIDAASRLLAEHLPATLAGRAADLGAGFGYLSAELLDRCPGIRALDLYEAEARALELAKQNLGAYADRAELGFHWHDVTTGLPAKYDVIVSNPPFHAQGSADRPDIGRRFITVAAQSLNRGGRLWLVANRHLPYEAALGEGFGEVTTVAQREGFKIIEAVRA